MPPEKVIIPDAPKHLPTALAETWKKTFAATLDELKGDASRPESEKRASALREANKLVRFTAPDNYEDAANLVEHAKAKRPEGWPVILHGEREVDGKPHLFIVTANGKKHFYEKPAAKTQDAPVDNDDEGAKGAK